MGGCIAGGPGSGAVLARSLFAVLPQETLVQYAPPWPWGITVVVLVATILLILAAYHSERGTAPLPVRWGLGGVRWLLVVLVVGMLYGCHERAFVTTPPDLVVLVDNSRSMATRDMARSSRRGTGDAPGEHDRLEQAKRWLTAEPHGWLDRWVRRYQVRLYTLHGEAVELDTESQLASAADQVHGWRAEVPRSPLGSRLHEILQQQQGRPTAAVVLLSDGAVTEGKSLAEVAEQARRQNVPLFVVGMGSSQPPPDVELSDPLSEEVVFVHDTVTLDVALTATGFAGQQVELQLQLQNAPGDVLATQQVVLPADGQTQRVRLAHQPDQPGVWQYQIVCRPQSGERRVDNNQVQVRVEVRDEQIQVLLVQGYPNYEYQYLKATLGRDTADGTDHVQNPIALTTVLQDADPEYGQIDRHARATFPATRDELAQYDVLLFGDVDPARLSDAALENVRDFVQQQGRGIVLMAGPRYLPQAYHGTPLASLFPFDPQAVQLPGSQTTEPFSVRLTPLGRSAGHLQLAATEEHSRRAWQNLPPLYWMVALEQVRPGVQVLAERDGTRDDAAAGDPLICMQYAGAGKVLFHATDETWRWRIRQGDPWFARYWLQTIRWLCRNKLGENQTAELRPQRDVFARGQPVVLRARFFDEQLAWADQTEATVVVQHEEGYRRHVKLRRRMTSELFQGTIPDLAVGAYHAWIADPVLPGPPASCRFRIATADRESSQVVVNAPELREAARRAGGDYFSSDSAAQLVEQLPAGRHVRIKSLPPRPRWNSPWLAGLFVTLIAAEWWLRKRVGML